MALHVKCRNNSYMGIFPRTPVPDAFAPWYVQWSSYSPMEYTNPKFLLDGAHRPSFADPPHAKRVQFNCYDSYGVNRVSHVCYYPIDNFTGRPYNPIGRTGVSGRGVLGRWGPNHAADALVYRFQNGHLQVITIRGKYRGRRALPGGMVNRHESFKDASFRELIEETMSRTSWPIWQLKKYLNFDSAYAIHSGYVDDSRNTDNAWVETVVYCYHADDHTAGPTLVAGDDATDAKWTNQSQFGSIASNHRMLLNMLF